MYGYLFGFSFLKSVIPYITEHVLTTLESVEFMFISYLLDFVLIFGMLVYICLTDHMAFFKRAQDTVGRMKKLTHTQWLSVFLISIFGIASTFMIFEMNTKYNPLIIFILTKVIPVVLIVVGSALVLNESFSLNRILGIAFAIASIYLLKA
jgi:drug/metabolite transporter (DMT)-like permease